MSIHCTVLLFIDCLRVPLWLAVCLPLRLDSCERSAGLLDNYYMDMYIAGSYNVFEPFLKPDDLFNCSAHIPGCT